MLPLLLLTKILFIGVIIALKNLNVLVVIIFADVELIRWLVYVLKTECVAGKDISVQARLCSVLSGEDKKS